ncbi:MAG: Hsp70 family protein [Myxococcales bacterium]
MAEGVKPVAIRVRLPYPGEKEFAEGYQSHVSRVGIFVVTDRPWAVGSWLSFEFLLASGQVVLRGQAMVARQVKPAPGVRPGMALRFLELDDDSHRFLDRICPPPASAPRDWVLGIDVGTTSTRVALVRNGRAELVPLGREGVIPSAVAIDAQGRLLVGARAKALGVAEPAHVVTGAKRWLGRRFEPAAAGRAPFRLVADERQEMAACLRGQTLPLTRICGEILRQARNLAQDALGTQIQRAVIGVPAYFTERQRAALRRAALLAGFSVDMLVSEPAAAAAAYAAGKLLPRRRLAVVDFGGGTFDATVLEVEGDQLEVVATGGDSFFGGMELDARIANLLAERFEEERGLSLADEAEAQQRLRDAAEAAKIALSAREETEVVLPCLCSSPGGSPIDLRTVLRRAEVEALCQDLVDQLADLTSEVLAAGKLAPRDVDEVLLVGGMTRMPAIRRRFERLFERVPVVDLDASSAVAFGAALLGAAAHEEYATLGLKDILGSALSVQLPDGSLKEVFARHTALPAERHLEVEAPNGAVELRVPVYQGGAQDPARDNRLGALELHGLAPGPAGRVRAVLTLSLTSDALLHVRAESGGVEQLVELQTLDSGDLPLAVLEGQGPSQSPDVGLPARSAGGE